MILHKPFVLFKTLPFFSWVLRSCLTCCLLSCLVCLSSCPCCVFLTFHPLFVRLYWLESAAFVHPCRIDKSTHQLTFSRSTLGRPQLVSRRKRPRRIDPRSFVKLKPAAYESCTVRERRLTRCSHGCRINWATPVLTQSPSRHDE